MSPITLLCEIVAQKRPVAAIDYRDCKAFRQLVAVGLLKKQGLVQSVLCDACDIGHDGSIVFEDQRYGHHCPEAGFVSVERDDLIAVAPDVALLASLTAAAFGCDSGKPRQIEEASWRVGVVRTEAADIAVYLHPCLETARDVRVLNAALRSQIRSRYDLVLTVAGDSAPAGMTTARLDQVLSFDLQRGSLVADADPAALVGAPVVRPGGRPATHASRIKTIIADRTASAHSEAGRNAEIRAVLAEFAKRFPNEPTPSRSTVARYLKADASGP